MMSEKEKMLSGLPYKAFGDELLGERQQAKSLVYQINSLDPTNLDRRKKLLGMLLGKTGAEYFIEPPFYCDYGYNIELGDNFYSNHNLVILDCAKVHIGTNVLIGPNVGIYAAGHPLHFEPRQKEYEYALPITIGNNVWIGGHVVINAGITIGDNSVIGSGSVVIKDIPGDVVAVGNPCKVLRPITDEDKISFYKTINP